MPISVAEARRLARMVKDKGGNAPMRISAREWEEYLGAFGDGPEFTITLPEPPSSNRWWRKFNNRMVLSAEARAYKASVNLAAKAAMRKKRAPTGAIAISLDWYRGRKSGDLDKRLGVAIDALQGAVYENDSQIVELVARRFDDKANPRLVVTVRSLTEDA